MENKINRSGEKASLCNKAAIVIAWLVFFVIASIIVGVLLLAGYLINDASLSAILICIIGGTLGSSISALISALDRVSAGFEFSDGTKYPGEKPPDKFVARMIPFFLIRPFLGSVIGLIVYVGLRGGYLISVRGATEAPFSIEGLLFISFIGGLMAKTFLGKLRDMFDVFFGKSRQKSKNEVNKDRPTKS